MANATYLTLDKKGRATIPEEVREALGVGPGDFVLLERTAAGGYELIAAELLPKDQRWFYHPEMQERVRAAEEEIAAGTVCRENVGDLARRLREPVRETPAVSAPKTRRPKAPAKPPAKASPRPRSKTPAKPSTRSR